MDSQPGSQGLSKYTYVFTTEVSSDPADFTTAQHPIWPFTSKHPRILQFQEGVHQHLTFNKTPQPMPETDSEDDEEPLSTADLNDRCRMKSQYQTAEKLFASMKFLCWPPHPYPCSLYQQPHPCIPTKESQPHLPRKPDQVEVPRQFELMEQDIPDDIPDLLDIPQEVMTDFDAWAHDVPSYQFW